MATPTPAELAISYRRYAERSNGGAVSAAWLHSLDAAGRVLRATVRRSVRDVVANKSRASLQSIIVDTTSGRCVATPPVPNDPAIVSYTLSPTGRYACAIKKEAPPPAPNGKEAASRVVIEIYAVESGALLVVCAPDAALHGDPLADSWWGDAVWSPDETMVAYLAEATPPTTPSFFEAAAPAKAGSPALPRGSQFDYQASGRGENWGEKYEAVRLPRLFIADIGSGTVVPVRGIPADVAAGQPEWAPSDGPVATALLTYTGWACSPRRLGIIYCYQRRCGLYAVDLTAELGALLGSVIREGGDDSASTGAAAPLLPPPPTHVWLTPHETVARCGRFSPLGSGGVGGHRVLVYLSSSDGPASDMHNGACALKALDWTAWDGASSPQSTTSPTTTATTTPAVEKSPADVQAGITAAAPNPAVAAGFPASTAVGLNSIVLVPTIDVPSAAGGVVSGTLTAPRASSSSSRRSAR